MGIEEIIKAKRGDVSLPPLKRTLEGMLGELESRG